MLLPNDMLDKMYYYHHDSQQYFSAIIDIVTVVYQGWFWKTSKTFKFRRKQVLESGRIIHHQTEECAELIKQLNEKMKDNMTRITLEYPFNRKRK